MPHFHTIRHVPHSARQMFDLVADVEAYPEFVPLCERLKVNSRTKEDGREVLTADMTIGYKAISETFASRVTLDPANGRIRVENLAGPMSHMENRWRFRDLDGGGSEVDFEIDYEFAARSFRLLMGAVFQKVFPRFAEAFEKRADEVYGRPVSA